MKRNSFVFALFILIIAVAFGSYFLNMGLNPLQLTWRVIVVIFLIDLFLIAVVILMEKGTPTRPSPGCLYS